MLRDRCLPGNAADIGVITKCAGAFLSRIFSKARCHLYDFVVSKHCIFLDKNYKMLCRGKYLVTVFSFHSFCIHLCTCMPYSKL